MAQQWALTWNVKPGTEEEVVRLFEESGRPDHTVRNAAGEEVGLLRRTSVFMRGNQVIRVIEFDGEFIDVAIHERRELIPGAFIPGPAVIVEDETSTVVSRLFEARIDAFGYIDLTRRGS